MNTRRILTVAVVAAFAAASMTVVAQSPAAPAPQAAPAEPLSALAPANIAKHRAVKAPFDLTGNWFIDTSVSAEA